MLYEQIGKSIFKSKTEWLNVIVMVLSIALVVFKYFGMDSDATLVSALASVAGLELTDFPPEGDYIIIAAANALLRLKTKEPVHVPSLSKPK